MSKINTRDTLRIVALCLAITCASGRADGPPGVGGDPTPQTLIGGPPRSWERGIPVSTYSAVNSYDGNLFTSVALFGWTGKGPDMNIVLFHNSRLAGGASLTETTLSADLGGWSMSFSDHLVLGIDTVIVVYADGRRDKYTLAPYVGPGGEPVWEAPAGVHSVLSQEGSAWKLTHEDQSVFEFDSQGKLTRMVNPIGYYVSIQRGATLGDPTVIWDGLATTPPEAGHRRIEIHRRLLDPQNPNSKVVVDRIVDPLWNTGLPGDRRWIFEYDGKGRLTEIRNPLDARIVIVPDSRGRIDTMTDQRFDSEPERTYDFDYTGNLIFRVTDPVDELGVTLLQEFAWSAGPGTNEYTTTYTDRRSNDWQLIYDTDQSTLLRMINPLTHSRRFEYDAGRNVSKYIDPLLNEWAATYDSRGNMLSVTTPAPFNETKLWTYDTLNNVLTYTDELQNTTTFHYEHPTKPTLLTSIVEPGENGPVTTVFDYYSDDPEQPDHMLRMVTDPNGVSTYFGYDQWGHESYYGEGAFDSQTAGATYPSNLAFTTGLLYNSLPHTSGMPNGPGEAAHTGTVHWNSSCQPTWSRCEGGGGVAGGGTPQVPPGFPALPCSDTSLSAATRRITGGSYDGMGRMLTLDLLLNYEHVSAGSRTIEKAYDHLGEPAAAQVLTDEYDSDGIDSLTRGFDYTYLASLGQILTTGPDGLESVRQFDAAGRLEYFRRGPSSSPVVSATLTHYADDLVETIAFENGATISYSYDNARRIENITHRNASGSPELTLDYTYTARGEIETIIENLGLPGQSAQAFTYDKQGQLRSECRDDIVACPTTNGVYHIEYTYDDGGNRLTKEDSIANTKEVYHYDLEPQFGDSENNRLMYYESFDTSTGSDVLSATTWFYYNQFGNTSRVVTQTAGEPGVTAIRFEYGHDRTAVTYVIGETWQPGQCGSYSLTFAREFRYDSERRRYLSRSLDPSLLQSGVYSPLSDTWSDYDDDYIYGDHSIAIDPPVGTPPTLANDRSFETGAGVVAIDGTSSQSTYFHTDHVGTVRMTSNEAGGLGSNYYYTAFGEQVCLGACPGWSEGDRFGFAAAWGYQSHGEFPFLHVGARYYDPATGRFLQRDPIGIRGGLNVYLYANGDPLMFVDPYGLDFWGSAGGFFLDITGGRGKTWLDRWADRSKGATGTCVGGGVGAVGSGAYAIPKNKGTVLPGQKSRTSRAGSWLRRNLPKHGGKAAKGLKFAGPICAGLGGIYDLANHTREAAYAWYGIPPGMY